MFWLDFTQDSDPAHSTETAIARIVNDIRNSSGNVTTLVRLYPSVAFNVGDREILMAHSENWRGCHRNCASLVRILSCEGRTQVLSYASHLLSSRFVICGIFLSSSFLSNGSLLAFVPEVPGSIPADDDFFYLLSLTFTPDALTVQQILYLVFSI